MPELPHIKRRRLIDQSGLSSKDVDKLMALETSGSLVIYDDDEDLIDQKGTGTPVAYFENVSRGRRPKVVLNW